MRVQAFELRHILLSFSVIILALSFHSTVKAQAEPYYLINVSTSGDVSSGFSNCTLRDAIGIVNAGITTGTVNGCVITSIGGTPTNNIYRLQLENYTYTLFASNGELVITGAADAITEVYIVGASNDPDDTIIQANVNANSANYRVFRIDADDANTLRVEFDTLTIRHGQCGGGCTVNIFGGGGFFNHNGAETHLVNTRMLSNTAGRGGSFANAGDNSRVEVRDNSLITGGTLISNGFQGGGFYASGGETIIEDSTITGNNAVLGGGFYATGADTTVTLDNAEIIGNRSGNGGGFVVEGSATVNIINGSQLTNNSADNDGGGFLTLSNGTVILDRATLRNNVANQLGGGFYNNGGTVTASNSFFFENIAAQGGAIHNNTEQTNAVRITASCIVDNSDVAFFNNIDESQTATGNWWRVADGPGGAGPGLGDTISVNVNFNDFLTVPPVGCPDFGANLAVMFTLSLTDDVLGNAEFDAGDGISYMLTIINNGAQDTTGVVVNVTFPPQIALEIPTLSQGTYDGIDWQVGALNVGEMATFSVGGTIIIGTAPGTFTATATITASDEPNPNVDGNNSDSASFEIIGRLPVEVPALAPIQPEDLGVIELPATGETPLWAQNFRAWLEIRQSGE